MSNDPYQPQPGKGKTPPKPSNSSGEPTESDLWDLDVAPSQKAPKPADPEALPVRRTSSSYSHPQRPTEGGGDKIPASPAEKPSTPIPAKDNKSGNETEAPTEQAAHAEDGGDPAKAIAAPPFSGSLTKIEKIAITALFAALILGAVLTLIHFSSRVPTRSPLTEETDYPVSGKLIEVKSAVTYWRKPITSGDNADIVRRGTALVPVVSLKLNSKPGAIRVFFRDEEGTVIGDGISRDVNGEEQLVIAATAGFDDIGMHAAYRTGEKEPWTVQVFEGSESSADHKDFRKVTETRISTDRR